MATSPVSALVNAEASLVNAVAATTELVKQVATSALPSALAELHDAVEQAKARIQSAAMLYRATISDLAFDINSLTADIFEDLQTASQPQPLPVPPVEETVSLPLSPIGVLTDPVVVAEEKEPEAEEKEVVTAVAANPPSEEPVAAPLVPVQGTQEGETESSPSSSSRKASKGKGKPAKGKATGKPK